MGRIQLNLYVQPGMVEAYVNFKDKLGNFKLRMAMIDTGAEQSLFPLKFLELYEHTIINPNLVIDQAGIAKQGLPNRDLRRLRLSSRFTLKIYKEIEALKWLFVHGSRIPRK
jgi:hypothetical protein